MRISNAFCYMFKGEKWFQSIITGTLIFCLLFFTSSIILTDDPTREYSTFMFLSGLRWCFWFLVMFFINGYCLYNANQRILNITQSTVSWKNLKVISKTGIKLLAAHWIYTIPLLWILVITFYMYITNTTEIYGAYIPQRSQYYPLAIKICNIISIIIGILIPIAFVKDLKFKTLFNIKIIITTIKNNILGFLIYVIWAIVEIYSVQHLQNITIKLPVLTVPFASFLAYYIMLVKSDFLVQLNMNNNQK